MALKAPLQFLILLVASWLGRRQSEAIEYLRAENRVLRAHLGAKRMRFTDAERRMLAEKGRPLGRKLLGEVASLATHRKRSCAGTGSRLPPSTTGRRRVVAPAVDVRRATRSSKWSPWRATIHRGGIRDCAARSRTWASTSGVRRSNAFSRLHGIEPAPVRGRTMPWKTFLKAHWGAIAAADFFSVEVLTVGGLVRHLVLFVIDLKTRRIHIAGITRRADGQWMAQMARNLTDAVAGPLRGFRHLIVDRDPLYTDQFKQLLATAKVELLRLPPNSPNLNAFAERFVRSIKSECMRHIIPLGERHLRTAIREYVDHYHVERNHQGLGNTIPFPSAALRLFDGPIVRRERLGGLLTFYERKAA